MCQQFVWWVCSREMCGQFLNVGVDELRCLGDQSLETSFRS